MLENEFDEPNGGQLAQWDFNEATENLQDWFEQHWDVFMACIEAVDDLRGLLYESDRYHLMSELPDDAVIDEWDCYDEDTEEHLDFNKERKYYREVKDGDVVKYYVSSDDKCVYREYNNAYTFDLMLTILDEFPLIGETPELEKLFDAYGDALEMTWNYE